MKNIAKMDQYELDDLDREIHDRRLELLTQTITEKGIFAISEIHGEPQDYALIYSPDEIDDLPNAWANPAECRILLDTLANLEPAEAYRRWYPKVSEKYPSIPYTKTDAIRDTREARKQLASDYVSGKIDGREYHDLYPTTSFLDLIEK